MRNVIILFLPYNTTGKLQPCDKKMFAVISNARKKLLACSLSILREKNLVQCLDQDALRRGELKVVELKKSLQRAIGRIPDKTKRTKALARHQTGCYFEGIKVDNLAHALGIMWVVETVLTREDVKESWEVTGLVPFDKDRVLSKLPSKSHPLPPACVSMHMCVHIIYLYIIIYI